MKIFVIHGYKSTATGNTDRLDKLGRIGQVIPLGYDSSASLDVIKDVLIKQISDNLDDKDEKIVIVGCSLGGYFANEICKRFNSIPILFNPCCYPYQRLGLSSFKGHDLTIHDTGDCRRPLVFLAKDDETIPYTEVVDYLGHKYICYIYKEGGHRFDLDNDKLEQLKHCIEFTTAPYNQ